MRPVNLRTDLRALADLIEMVFADSMDSKGRSAIREMRYLSHMGFGLRLVARMNELALGISLGFVQVLDGDLVGNISVYPARYPKDMGEAWILANVAVHPGYRGRGIGGDLVEAALAMIRKRRGRRVILQVSHDNEAALRLYGRHGFVYERAWRVWRRSGYLKAPFAGVGALHITRPGRGEWLAEYDLARQVRPNSRGGLGWLTPLHHSYFRVPAHKRLLNLFSLNSREKLIIRDPGGRSILASCWLESAISSGNLRLRLFVSPHADQRQVADALLGNVLARYHRSTITIEHPRDDDIVNDLLERAQFKVKRDLWHMRLDV